MVSIRILHVFDRNADLTGHQHPLPLLQKDRKPDHASHIRIRQFCNLKLPVDSRLRTPELELPPIYFEVVEMARIRAACRRDRFFLIAGSQKPLRQLLRPGQARICAFQINRRWIRMCSSIAVASNRSVRKPYQAAERVGRRGSDHNRLIYLV